MVLPAMKTLVLDNGAYTIKAGYVENPATLHTVRNCVVRGKGGRLLIADQLETCSDFSGVTARLPFERGFIVNWELQRDIWNRLFSKDVTNCDASETTLLLTEPCFNLPNIRQSYDEIVFEEFGFAACHRTPAPTLCRYLSNDSQPPECMLVVDTGYSFTHVVPLHMGRPISHAVKRIDVGGKLITNHLKEAISFRQWNMMDETFLVNEVKELCCYISQKFHEDQELCRRSFPDNTVKLDYVLPDMALGTKGFIRSPGVDAARPDEQILVMNNERFTVPEILFNPSDIGIEQAGIPEAIIQAVQQIDPDLQGLFYSNILVVGGNAHLLGFKERLETELRSLIPLEFDLGLTVADRPDTAAWHGAVNWVRRYPEDFRQKCVTRQDYLEHGHNICQQSFD